MLIPRAKRPMCLRCYRPVRSCICHLVKCLANRVEILVLQDKNEATNAKNTAGLLHLSLKNSQVYTCEADTVIPSLTLEKLLFDNGKQPLLLYPPTENPLALGLEPASPLPAADELDPDMLRLVILDATWRKSRKMLYLNRQLQPLPRVVLENPPASLYLIRKADNKNQLSTLEASCYALQQLEQGTVDYSPLLASMRDFMAQQIAFRPV